jgi:NAD-reducing hydrogenase small subunit
MTPNAKPRFATVWLGGCSGCHMSFLDLDERLIDLAGLVDVCYSPVVDVKEFPENVDIVLVEGAVANEDNLREIRLIRQRSKVLVAFGDCAVTGNVTALRNLFKVEDVLDRAYKENSAVISGLPLGGDGIIPKLLDRVLRVQDVVPVDHFLPGCPPSADTIYAFVADMLGGQSPSPEGRKFGT